MGRPSDVPDSAEGCGLYEMVFIYLQFEFELFQMREGGWGGLGGREGGGKFRSHFRKILG